MDALCAYCGVYDAYYQCNSCNKKFCIYDWDKVHNINSHQKLRIILPINEKSRKILIELFESIKNELLDDFNRFKKQALQKDSKKLKITLGGRWISLFSNTIISYLMKIKSVNKKLLYLPIEYCLANSEILAEKYTKSFNIKEELCHELYKFFMYNYFGLDSKIVYGLSFDPANKDFSAIISEILNEYLKNRQYKVAYEFLNNLREFSTYLAWLELDINDEITIIQNFIAHLIDQDFNVDLVLWDRVENKIKQKTFKPFVGFFYIAFQRIFHILNNRKYFVKCSKSLLKLGRDNHSFLSSMYYTISCYYLDEGNTEKYKKYLLKAYHTLAKDGNLIIISEPHAIFAFKIIWKLSTEYNSYFDIYKNFVQQYEWVSYKTLIYSSYYSGRIMLNLKEYDDASYCLKQSIFIMKKTKLIDYFLMGHIHFYLGKIFFGKDNFEAAIKEIYKAKEILEKRLIKDNKIIVLINKTLGDIYVSRHWYDESLKYYNIAKESLPILGKKHVLLRYIDYHIAKVHCGKGDYAKALSLFENCLNHSFIKRRTDTLIIIHAFISIIHCGFGDFEKSYHHAENAAQLFDSYQGSYSWADTCIQFIPNILTLQGKYELCEKVCHKCLECKENQNKNAMFAIHMCLLKNYEYQKDYKKADSVLEYLKLNLVNFNSKEGWHHQINVLIFIGELFYRRDNFDEAEIYFKKAEEILEKQLKTYIDKKADVYLWLGSNFYSKGRLEESESYLLKALDIYLNNFFWTSGILKIYYLLGYLYLLKNDFPKQKHYHWEFIKLCEEKNTYGEYLKVATSLLYHCKKLNDEDTAQECYSHLREYYKKHLPGIQFHLDIASDKNDDMIRVHFDTKI